MDKKFIICSIIFSAVSILNGIIYFCLLHFHILEPEFSRYMLNFAYLILIWLPIFIVLIFKVKFSLFSIIIYDIFMFAAVVIGSAYNIYDRLSLYDKIVHFASGIIVSLLFYDIFHLNSKNKLNNFWLFLFVLSVTMLIGGVWEIYEFSYDSLAGGNSQKWANEIGHNVLNDSMYDLICDFTGGVIGAIIAVLIENKRIKQPK